MMDVTMSQAVTRALRVIASHPAVVGVAPGPNIGLDVITATVGIDTNLPGPWRAAGCSENGVLAVEEVVFVFTPRYPLAAPRIFLREDFDRAHPHLLPLVQDLPPEPCFLAGSTREMMRSRGILGVVGQVADWLERAALVRLMDPSHGWEPTRRDNFDDVTVCDPDWLRGTAGRDATAAVYDASYGVHDPVTEKSSYLLFVGQTPQALTADLPKTFTVSQGGGQRWGTGLALVASSGKTASGTPFVADRYLPETVTDIASLHRRAHELGCGDVFTARMVLIQRRLKGIRFKTPLPLAVLLLARRPCNIIGSDSPLEICPYLIELTGSDDLSPSSNKPVRIAMHRDTVSIPLLRRASGDHGQERPSWTLLGCVSIGSKIAVHMARRGRGPSVVVDQALMQPHNWARHALLPAAEGPRVFAGKAEMLADTLATLQQPARAVAEDILDEFVLHPDQITSVFTPDHIAVVNATGSVAVREALMAYLPQDRRARIVETCLLGAGAIAYMSVEGARANPSSVDLAVEAYHQLRQDTSAREAVFSAQAQAITIGQGCSSLTFPLSDARLSSLTAPMAEVLAEMTKSDLSPMGEILLGRLDRDGLNQAWSRIPVEPWRVIPPAKEGDPAIRISPRVDRAIQEAVAAMPDAETGGVLIGRFVDLTNTFHIVDLLPAPPDSRFSPCEFILGTEGLAESLDEIVLGTGGALYPLGTWHSHLVPSGASAKDIRTALRLAAEQIFPVLMLIHTPDGYRSLVVETSGPLPAPLPGPAHTEALP